MPFALFIKEKKFPCGNARKKNVALSPYDHGVEVCEWQVVVSQFSAEFHSSNPGRLFQSVAVGSQSTD